MAFDLTIPPNLPEIAEEAVHSWLRSRALVFGVGKKDYSWILEDPGAEHLSGIIFWLNRMGLLRIPTDINSFLAQSYYQNQARWLSWEESISRVLWELSESGISWMPLKGLALRPYIYPEPGMRWIGDVDLLIWSGSFLRACSVIKKLGFYPVNRDIGYLEELYEQADDGYLPAEIEFQDEKGLIIDLHSRLNNAAWSQDLYHINTENIWTRSKNHGPFAELGGRELQPEDTLAYLCFHLGKHGMGALSFHTFLDVDLWLRYFGERLDGTVFINRVREWRIRPMVWFVLDICQRFLHSFDDFLKTRSILTGKNQVLQQITPGFLMRSWISYWIEPEMLFYYQRWRRNYHPSYVSVLMAEHGAGTIKAITQMVLPSANWRHERYGSSVSLLKYWRHVLKVITHY